MRLMLFCISAPNAPISIDSAEMIAMICCQDASCGPNAVNITCASTATAAIFGAVEKNATTGAGAPS